MQSAFTAIGSFFSDLLLLISDSLQFIVDVFKQIFIDLWEFLTDCAVWVFDQIMGLVEYIISFISVPTFPNFWSGLSGEAANTLGLIGIAESLALIGASLLIRISLQLIPATRLGS